VSKAFTSFISNTSDGEVLSLLVVPLASPGDVTVVPAWLPFGSEALLPPPFGSVVIIVMPPPPGDVTVVVVLPSVEEFVFVVLPLGSLV